MTRPPEPIWPTVDEAVTGSSCGMPNGEGCYSRPAAQRTIELCRAAWLVSVDDPTADLPGTVRTSPDGKNVAVRVDATNQAHIHWHTVVSLQPAEHSSRRWGWFDADVRGWTFTCNIPGTPAWDAAQAVSS